MGITLSLVRVPVSIDFSGQSRARKTVSMFSSEGFVRQLMKYFVKVGENTTMTAVRALGKNENVILENMLLTDIRSIRSTAYEKLELWPIHPAILRAYETISLWRL